MSVTALAADGMSAAASGAVAAAPIPNQITAAPTEGGFRGYDVCVLALIVLVQLSWVSALSYGLFLLV
jgi:hypothetical protein